MNIIDEINEINKQDLISIDEANYLGGYSVNIKFNDNIENIINFEPFLTNSIHPQIRKYLDKDKFKSFSIVDGNLNWNDYDLIFPLEDLYEGKI